MLKIVLFSTYTFAGESWKRVQSSFYAVQLVNRCFIKRVGSRLGQTLVKSICISTNERRSRLNVLYNPCSLGLNDPFVTTLWPGWIHFTNVVDVWDKNIMRNSRQSRSSITRYAFHLYSVRRAEYFVGVAGKLLAYVVRWCWFLKHADRGYFRSPRAVYPRVCWN